ncbi:metallopeptidase [Xylariaceae sp. FL1651]|nr:metallopeptidase [Xylariaceae sp. FL1651]
MAPKFSLKDLRRRSLASFKTDRSTDTSSNDEPSGHDTTPSVGSITPPSLPDETDPALNAQTPAVTRPPLEPNTNRYSIAESIGPESPAASNPQAQLQYQQPLSQYAPRLTNIPHKSTVNQKVLLVVGIIGQDPQSHPVDGTVTVFRHDKAFPVTQWPVYGARFKALVYLLPGPNALSFKFQKYGSNTPHTSHITIFMFDPKNAPPLQLAILVAKDSPGTYDAVPARVQKEGNDLDTAISKYRMAAYLWQSFTAEQMDKNGLGRRAFRFEEEWTNGTSHPLDGRENTMRSEARVHVIPTDKTVAEIRDLECAQQNPKGTKKNELFNIVATAVRNYFHTSPGQKQCVAVMILDSHWDTKEKMITGHAALGGAAGDDLHLAIFGSHCLQSYPKNIEQVLPAFSDCTPTNTNLVANDANEAGSSWEAAALGIGAHLHEIGHLLGSPHQESGIMARDFITLNRTFLVREAYSTRTKSKGGVVEPKDEPTWHRLDLLRYRYHPLFRNAGDLSQHLDGTVYGWAIENQKILVTAASGLLCTEIFAEGDEFCRTWIEYPRDRQSQRTTTLTEAELRGRLPENKRRAKIKIIVRSMGGGELVINDFHELCTTSTLKLSSGPFGQPAFRSTKLGFSQMEGSEPQEVIFNSAITSKNRILLGVTVYHGTAVDGLEFHYDDGSSQLFGKRGGKPGGDKFMMDIPNAEVITGFIVRCGLWIDAIQIITSTSRKSDVYGKADGGSPHTLLVPRGYRICGVSGTCAAWLDGFSLLITR